MNSQGTPAGEDYSVVVDDAAAGERVDLWLSLQFPDLSRSAIKRYIDESRVLIDGQVPKPSAILKVGSRLEVKLPPPPPSMPIPQDIPLDVVYDDEAIIVISKPAGLVVHSSPGVAEGGSVVNALLHITNRLSTEGGDYRPGIVHRLDRETSGLLVIARTDVAHRHIGDQFRARIVKKEYVACIHGTPRELEGEIDEPLGRSFTQRRKMTIRPDSRGKESQTLYRVEHTQGDFSWVRCFPRTGRTHQIRVHLKSIQHPIICDGLYGREKFITRSELLGKKPPRTEAPILERHALHAHRLQILHPGDEREISFEAPFPPDLQAVYELFAPGE